MSSDAAVNQRMRDFIAAKWDAEVVPVLSEYIKVPNQSPAFDKEFATNGLQEQAMALLVDWVKKQEPEVKGMKWELLEEAGRTPFLLIEIAGTVDTAKTMLMYGHMDKQPPLLPWAEGLDPYTPVYKDGKLYGRAGADDGYAIFASLLTVMAMQREGIPHATTAIIIEGCEESGSFELPYWVDKVKSRLGDVDLVVCLDSGALTYDQLWITTALRGVVVLEVEAAIMTEGVHSGIAGGVLPDSFQVMQRLLARLQDAETGEILVPECHCEIPEHSLDSLRPIKDLGDEFRSQFPALPGMQFNQACPLELALNNYWRPTLSVVGADGLPPTAEGGNVLRASTKLRLSMRMPPLVDAKATSKRLVEILSENPPNGATVKVDVVGAASGWAAPPMTPWLKETLDKASVEYWGKPCGGKGEGGTIPFMGMLGDMFPKACFAITGVLGPQSNAHGPNEFLHVPFGKGINYACIHVVAEHFRQQPESKQ